MLHSGVLIVRIYDQSSDEPIDLGAVRKRCKYCVDLRGVILSDLPSSLGKPRVSSSTYSVISGCVTYEASAGINNPKNFVDVVAKMLGDGWEVHDIDLGLLPEILSKCRR